MSNGAKDQVARLLALVPMLHASGQVSLGEAARRLDVTPEALLRDLKVLFMVGLPGGYPDDLIDVDLDSLEGPHGADPNGMIRISNADYLSRPLRLTATEASAIIVALRAMANGADESTREIIGRATAKLEGAAAGTTSAIDPGLEADPDQDRLATTLESAIRQGRQVRLTYYVPARDEESQRMVDPRGLAASGTLRYLDAWCHTAEAPRLFRLDRIAEAEVLDTPVSEHATPNEPGSGASGVGSLPEPEGGTVVTLRLAPAARWVTEYYPVTDVRAERPEDDASPLLVDLRVADPRWLTRLLLRLAPNAEVVSPDGYSEQFVNDASATLDLYRHAPRTMDEDTESNRTENS